MGLLTDAQTAFTTIATILGTGILGLPVKLAYCGFAPFMLSFPLCLAMQLAVVWLMTDLLQRTHALNLSNHMRVALPNLHDMGALFLTGTQEWIFQWAVVLHFVSVLIGYALATSEAYGQLFGIPFEYLVLPVIVSLTAAVLFGERRIAPVISIFTAGKCVLLILMIVIIGVVSAKVDLEPISIWRYALQPYLLGTVALGGVVNIMPLIYGRIEHTTSGIKRFRLSVCLGVCFCWMLNVLWAFFVLRIVPQTRSDAILHGMDVSLFEAQERGEISTVPTAQVIGQAYPQYRWIADIVTVFIVISVTVSYLTLGAGAKHMLDGVARSIGRNHGQKAQSIDQDTSNIEVELTSLHQPQIMGSGSAYFETLTDRPDRDGAEVGPGTDEHGSSHHSGSADTDDALAGINSPSGATAKQRDPTARRNTDAAIYEGAAFQPSSSASPEPLGTPVHSASSLLQRWRHTWYHSQAVRSWAFYALTFGGVALISLLNPSGFFWILEVFTSLALNLEAGALIAVMSSAATKVFADRRRRRAMDSTVSPVAPWELYDTRTSSANDLNRDDVALTGSNVEHSQGSVAAAAQNDTVPVPLGERAQSVLVPFTILSFGFAVFYDILSVMAELWGWTGATKMVVALVICYIIIRNALHNHQGLPSALLTDPETSIASLTKPDAFDGSQNQGEDEINENRDPTVDADSAASEPAVEADTVRASEDANNTTGDSEDATGAVEYIAPHLSAQDGVLYAPSWFHRLLCCQGRSSALEANSRTQRMLRLISAPLVVDAILPCLAIASAALSVAYAGTDTCSDRDAFVSVIWVLSLLWAELWFTSRLGAYGRHHDTFELDERAVLKAPPRTCLIRLGRWACWPAVAGVRASGCFVVSVVLLVASASQLAERAPYTLVPVPSCATNATTAAAFAVIFWFLQLQQACPVGASRRGSSSSPEPLAQSASHPTVSPADELSPHPVLS